MTQYDNKNKGVLFKNERKSNESQPDYSGTINVVCEKCGHGNEMRLASWINTAKDGVKKFMSINTREGSMTNTKAPEYYQYIIVLSGDTLEDDWKIVGVYGSMIKLMVFRRYVPESQVAK